MAYPDVCLAALTRVLREIHQDPGMIADRTFVICVSFGFYRYTRPRHVRPKSSHTGMMIETGRLTRRDSVTTCYASPVGWAGTESHFAHSSNTLNAIITLGYW